MQILPQAFGKRKGRHFICVVFGFLRTEAQCPAIAVFCKKKKLKCNQSGCISGLIIGKISLIPKSK